MGWYRRPVRRPLFPTAWSLAAVAVTVVVAGCSGSDGATGPVPTVPLGSAPSTDPAANAGGVDSGGVDSGGSDRDATEITATPRAVTATVRSGVLDGALTVELDAPDAGDPFGRFASCSGSRSVVGAYSVLVADPAGVVRSISVISNDPVDGPGIHDAAVRIEPFAGAPIAGQGTLTLNDGMTSGS